MANGKNSFLIYCDTLKNIEHLTNEEKGILFQHLLEYVNDLDPVLNDRLILTAWKPIEQTLKRDLKKWEHKSEQNSKNAKIRWDANACKRIRTDANDADSVNVTVNDNDNDNDINKRKAEFKNSIQTNYPKYSIELLDNFYEYWTQHNPQGKKMKFEYTKFQPFHISYRLGTFLKNQNKWEKEKTLVKKEKVKLLSEKMKENYGIK